MSVPNIVKITNTIYIGDFPRDMSEEKSATDQGLICAEILLLRVLPRSPSE